MSQQKQIQLAKRPQGLPTKDVFHFETVDIPVPQDGEVLIQTKYVSVDPYMRGQMQDTKSYTPPFKLNEVIQGGVVGEVMKSLLNRLNLKKVILFSDSLAGKNIPQPKLNLSLKLIHNLSRHCPII